MADELTGTGLARQLDVLLQVGVIGDRADPELIRQYLLASDAVKQAAFAALVARHSLMVTRVCRQVLGASNDAQDAFQATFLILARRAGSIRQPEALASWLHGVALRVATRARADSARRLVHERRWGAVQVGASTGGEDSFESWPGLHAEIARLPERYREPVVLHYLEGLTVEATAARIGCPRGTILSRLARARDRLKGRLTRRGLAPADLILLTQFSTSTTPFRLAVPAVLGPTLVSSGAGRLLKGALIEMLIDRWRRAGLLLAACGTSVGAIALGGLSTAPAPPRPVMAEARAPQNPPTRVESSKQALSPSHQAESLAFAPGGQKVIARCANGRILILDPTAVAEPAILQDQDDTMHTMACSPDGSTLAGAGDGNVLKFWDLATGKLRRTIPALGAATLRPTALAFGPDGKTLAIVGRAEPNPTDPLGAAIRFEVRLLDLTSGLAIWDHLGRGAIATAVAFSPDGLTLATSGHLAVRLWDARTGDPGILLESERANPLRLTFAPDGKRLAAVGFFLDDRRFMVGQVTIWDPATGARLRTLDAPNRAVAIAFSPNGQFLAAGGCGFARAYTTASGAQGHMVASETRLWDVVTGDRLWSSEGDLGGVTSLAFAPDGQSLARCDEETVALIDPRTGKMLRILMTTPRRL